MMSIDKEVMIFDKSYSDSTVDSGYQKQV